MNENSNKLAIIWYGLAVFIVLAFTILPSVSYHNSWTKPMIELDSIGKLPEGAERLELLNKAGAEILKEHYKHPYHARIQLVAAYYFFLKGNMDSVIFHSKEALDKGSGGVVNSLEDPARELLANATINKGFQLLSASDTLAAFKLYASIAKYTPNHPVINKNLGLFYINQKKSDAAMYHFYVVMNTSRNDAEAMMGLARAYYLKGNIDSVRHYATSALKVNPQIPDAQNFLNITQ